MVRAITLLLLLSPLNLIAGDNTMTIVTKGSGSTITAKQVGNGNATTIICGANTGGYAHSGYSYNSHTCGSANLTSNVTGNSNVSRIYTVWSNHIGNRYTINTDGNDNFAWIDQDEDDNTSSITQDGNSNHAEQLGSGDDNTYTISQTGNTKYAKILSFGDDGSHTIAQTGTGSHNAYIYNNNTGHNNETTIIQSGSGNKDGDVKYYSGGNDVDLTQSGNGAHQAFIQVNTGNYTIDVTQTGASAKAFTTTFNCSSGCTKTISITQQD